MRGPTVPGAAGVALVVALVVAGAGCGDPEAPVSPSDPALLACAAERSPSRTVSATARPGDAPRIAPSAAPLLVRVPEGGRGLVRFDLVEPRSIMVFTREPRQARRIVTPTVIRVGTTAIDSSAELCGGVGAYQAMGRGGSNERCRAEIREHLYFDPVDPGAYYLEITGEPGSAVWLVLTWAEGHPVAHHDEHAHHH